CPAEYTLSSVLGNYLVVLARQLDQHRAPCVVDLAGPRELEANEGLEVWNATPVEVDMMGESPRREHEREQHHERHPETHATARACGPHALGDTGDGGSIRAHWALRLPRPLHPRPSRDGDASDGRARVPRRRRRAPLRAQTAPSRAARPLAVASPAGPSAAEVRRLPARGRQLAIDDLVEQCLVADLEDPGRRGSIPLYPIEHVHESLTLGLSRRLAPDLP